MHNTPCLVDNRHLTQYNNILHTTNKKCSKSRYAASDKIDCFTDHACTCNSQTY